MKPPYWIGILLLALGLLSLVIPIPHRERDGFTAGGVTMRVETQHSETVLPIISACMILGGVGILIMRRGRKPSAL
jgi:hypothetical protein